MIGPMAAAIILALRGIDLRMPQPLFYGAQGVVGCMIAHSLTAAIIAPLVKDWPLFLITIVGIIAASTALGYLLASWRVLPGTTAVWGSSAGAATAMTLMAEDYGEDIRIVAFMQYLRMGMVALASAIIAKLCMGAHAGQAHFLQTGPVAWQAFAATLTVTLAATALARRLKIPGGTVIVPLVAAAALSWTGEFKIELPPLFLAASYAVIGFTIGLRFTKDILKSVARALPQIVGTTLALMAICAGIGMILAKTAGISPLTAYFATTPGGMDSAAIIAADSNVDMPFVMALQFARFMLVVLSGPWLARLVANRITKTTLKNPQNKKPGR